MSTNAYARQRQLAREIEEAVDLQVLAFNALLAELVRRLEEAKRRNSRRLLELAVASFIANYLELIESATGELSAWAVERVNAVLSVSLLANAALDWVSALVAKAGRLVNHQLERQLDDALLTAAQTGKPYVAVASAHVVAASAVNTLRREVDIAATRSVQRTIWRGGAGVIDRKVWIAVVDSRTTDVCLDLHLQVQPWDQPFVHASGAQVMHPPAIGAEFSPKYHACRSASLPVVG